MLACQIAQESLFFPTLVACRLDSEILEPHCCKKGDSPLLMMWWCSLCGRVSPDAALWAHVMVWWRLQLVTAVPSEPDNNNLLWRLHSKYNMYLIIHSITFCFYTIILSSSMSVFSSNDWDIHFQLLRFIHFDAFMLFYRPLKEQFQF